MSESQTPVQDQRCQSGPSTRNSVILSEGEFSNNYGADQQRLQISDLHFDIPYTSHVCLVEDKIQDRGTDAKIASALNKIIHNSHFKRRISLEEQEAQKQDRFLRGRQIAYLIYEYFRVTGANASVENYTDLFTTALRNDDIQEFDSKWDGILFSITKIPSGDILEGLYKLRIRESQNSRPCWNCTTWRSIRTKPDLIITD